MTGSATTILLLVSAAAVAVVTVFLARMIHQLVRTGVEVERLARSLNDELVPKLDRVLEQTQAELAEIEALTRSAKNIAASADRIVETIGDVVVRAQDSVTPALDAVAEFSGYLRRGTAVMAGVRAGLTALRRPKLEEPEEIEWGV